MSRPIDRHGSNPARMIGGLILNLTILTLFVAAMGVLIVAVTL